MKIVIVAMIFLLSGLFAAAADPAQPLIHKVPLTVFDLIGQTYIDVIYEKGYPNAMFPVRQSKKNWDDIVFDYEGSFFYLYNNRLYRVYYSSDYKGEIHKGLTIGSPRSKLAELFGNRYTLEDDGYVWHWQGKMILAKFDDKHRLSSLWIIVKIQK